MEFCSEFPKLEPADQERFKTTVTRLLSGHVLTPGSPMQQDSEWRFCQRYELLVDAYLRLGGWRLDLDRTLRLGRAVHEGGEQRIRLNKFESLVVCLLRLVYHEQMREAHEDLRCEMKIGELKERLIQAGKPSTQVTRRAVYEVLRRLARHSIVSFERGFAAEDTESFVLGPLLEKVLPPDRVAELAERVKSYRGAEETDEDGGAEGQA